MVFFLSDNGPWVGTSTLKHATTAIKACAPRAIEGGLTGSFMFLTGWRVGGRAEHLLVLSVALESAGDARETARARMSSIMLRRR